MWWRASGRERIRLRARPPRPSAPVRVRPRRGAKPRERDRRSPRLPVLTEAEFGFAISYGIVASQRLFAMRPRLGEIALEEQNQSQEAMSDRRLHGAHRPFRFAQEAFGRLPGRAELSAKRVHRPSVVSIDLVVVGKPGTASPSVLPVISAPRKMAATRSC